MSIVSLGFQASINGGTVTYWGEARYIPFHFKIKPFYTARRITYSNIVIFVAIFLIFGMENSTVNFRNVFFRNYL